MIQEKQKSVRAIAEIAGCTLLLNICLTPLSADTVQLRDGRVFDNVETRLTPDALIIVKENGKTLRISPRQVKTLTKGPVRWKRNAKTKKQALPETETETVRKSPPSIKPKPSGFQKESGASEPVKTESKKEAPRTPDANKENETKKSKAKSALYINLGLSRGTFDPDLEPRGRDGRLVHGLFQYGSPHFQTPWRNKEYLATPVSLRYETGRWLFSGAYSRLNIRPDFFEFLRADNVTVTGSNPGELFLVNLEAFGYTRYGNLQRETKSLGAGYRLSGSESNGVNALIGIREWNLKSELNQTQNFQNKSPSQSRFGGTFSGQGRESRYTFFDGHENTARGPSWGLEYRQRIGSLLDFRFGLGFFALQGSWKYENLRMKDTRSLLQLTVGATTLFGSDQSRYFHYRRERGRLDIFGQTLAFTAYRPVSEKIRLFIALGQEASNIRTSEVELLLLTSNFDKDHPYEQRTNAFTNAGIDTVLTHAGGTHPEVVRDLRAGVEIKI